jgi:mRNA interferase RelE/StbE
VSSKAYTVIIIRPAQKEIKALDQTFRARILQALHSLTNDPRPSGCRKLVGAQNRWRVRVGDYRIIYEINDASSSLNIIAVRHRSKAYE